MSFTSGLLALRHARIVPHLKGAGGDAGRVLLARDGLVAVDWHLNRAVLGLRANLSEAAAILPDAAGVCLLGTPGPLAAHEVAIWLEEVA